MSSLLLCSPEIKNEIKRVLALCWSSR